MRWTRWRRAHGGGQQGQLGLDVGARARLFRPRSRAISHVAQHQVWSATVSGSRRRRFESAAWIRSQRARAGANLGDRAPALALAGVELARHQAEVGLDLMRVVETLRILINFRDEGGGGDGPDAGNSGRRLMATLMASACRGASAHALVRSLSGVRWVHVDFVWTLSKLSSAIGITGSNDAVRSPQLLELSRFGPMRSDSAVPLDGLKILVSAVQSRPCPPSFQVVARCRIAPATAGVPILYS
jgi:hypothetical protein